MLHVYVDEGKYVHEMIDQNWTNKNNDKRKHQLNVFTVVLFSLYSFFRILNKFYLFSIVINSNSQNLLTLTYEGHWIAGLISAETTKMK